MPRLIDIEDYCKNHCRCKENECDKTKCPIWNVPAVDAEPVKHAAWRVTFDTHSVNGAGKPTKHIECTACGAYWSEPMHAEIFERCYKCGAIMDVEPKK